ncbi:MAG: insulinase family protein, partial [Chloroflexi bacterium]|nr:insulinase family protein [Chloroflexota bacterium]
AYAETIYAPSSPFSRPLGGLADTVERLERRHLVERHAVLLDPTRATLIVAGDLDGISLADMAQSQLGGWSAASIATASEHQSGATFDDSAHPAGPRTVLVDRPGSPQTEIRIGHVGLSRRIPDFHAVAVMAAMLGGLFNSRLNRLLREERGYTYGASAGFELRRAAGPFAVRTAVQTEVTVPAVEAVLAELRRIREGRVEEAELKEARDYLIGVFPLRFEAPPQVIAAIAGLIIFGLPDDELDRYRPAVASVTADDVLSAAGHVRPDDASIVLVGDAMSMEGGLRDAGLPQLTVVRDPLPTEQAEEAETR